MRVSYLSIAKGFQQRGAVSQLYVGFLLRHISFFRAQLIAKYAAEIGNSRNLADKIGFKTGNYGLQGGNLQARIGIYYIVVVCSKSRARTKPT